jgi:integrase
VARVQREAETGVLADRSKATLETFLFGTWLPAMEPTLAPSTVLSYKNILRARVAPTLGAVPLQALAASQLNALYARLLANGRSNGGGALSHRSVRYTHTVVRKALKDACRWGLVGRNVADLANPPKVTKTRKWTTWSPSEIGTFLRHVEADRLSPLWELTANTGMRRGELLGLRWEDLDFDAATVTIRRALVVVGYKVMIRPTKTDRPRVIALDAGMVAILNEWRRFQLEERLAWGPAYHDSGYIFTKEDGSPLHPDETSKRFNRLLASVAIPRIRFHDVRHTWATTALAAGVHPKIVAERLGHGSIQITLDTYSHVMPQQDRAAGELVASLYRTAGGKPGS